MTRNDSWKQVSEIFGQAIELLPNDRGPFLEVACAAAPAGVRAEVERLLALHQPSDNFLEPPALMVHAPPDASAKGATLIGRTIGRYRITSHIAAGGMGLVFEAEQESPRRKVALKIVHPSLISPELLRRLTFEAQVLARLRHPGIAQIYEAGVHDFGDGAQPFFAMELIDGEPVTAFAAAQNLNVRQRIELFINIAQAVQHAHEKGVIHRDLKPANILVEVGGQPKVLDFGVARLTDSDVQMTNMHTAAGVIVGTIRYMSPEQLGGGEGGASGDIDTRSDIYALGVIGYELLAGRLPYDLPSGSMAGAITTIEKGEVVPLGKVNRTLRGDLECIFMKALEHDRARRYSTAAELADDLQRFLANEPVRARPATTFYQVRKFARRNRPFVGGVLATIVALAVGLFLYANEARRSRRAATEAQQSAAKATAVSDFLVRMLANIDPNRQSENVNVADLVDRAATEIDTVFAHQPLEQAAVRNEVGTIYYNLGKYDKADREYKMAMDLRLEHLGEENADTLNAINNLGQTMAKLGRGEESMSLYRRALDGRTRVLGEDHERTLITANNLAMALQGQGNVAGAEAMLRRCMESQIRTQGERSEATLVTMGNLAVLLHGVKKRDEAEALARRSLNGFLILYGQNHALTCFAQGRLATLIQDSGRDDEANQLWAAALAGMRQTLGDHHRDTAIVASNFAKFLSGAKQHAAAANNYRLALNIFRELHGPDHKNVLTISSRLAAALLAADQLDEAHDAYEQFLQATRRVHGEHHDRTIAAMQSLADLEKRRGRDDEAATWQAQADAARASATSAASKPDRP